jgi:DNA helicase-4
MAVNEYLRDSNINFIGQAVNGLISNYSTAQSSWNIKLDKYSINNLNNIKKYLPLEANKELIRIDYETRKLLERKSFYDKIESNPLTEQQRLAVLRDNDLNLVLAAAGTGKTSVMVAKALDLIDSGKAKSEDILILAYNKAAANELKERLLERSSQAGLLTESIPSISTFHALGRKILKESRVTTYLSDFIDDPKKLEMWISDWLKKYITSSPKALFSFIELSYQPTNPFDFKNKAEYDAYVRDNEYRTLQGERVRGYQELLIANWLFIHGVNYEYEAPYITKRRIDIGFDYRPDFHIIDTSIYLEHFGIARNGKTRPDIDAIDYNDKINEKRELHKQQDTTLIETYHYDWTEGRLEERLLTLMNENGVEIKYKTEDEIFTVLENLGIVIENAKRYLKCLQAIRVERLSNTSILERLKLHKVPCAEQYTELLDQIHTAYKNKLLEDNRIDFDDMIIKSTEQVTSKVFTPKWKHILVDEFQDISKARMELLQAFIDYGPKPIMTVVGDDWQSIYRFSGGKLELTTRFESLVGTHSLSKLEKTYRYNNSIADTAGAFVMQNPEQYKKNVITNTTVTDSTVYLVDTIVEGGTSIEDRVLQVVNKIRSNDTKGSIAVLARYRYLLNNARDKINSETQYSDLKYWTFHGSKGLEADYCILIGFFQGKTGFPNANKEEAIVEALLPSLDHFPHSEERRLLYVALTRAKQKSYLLADPKAPSQFINEMLSPKYKLHIASKTFEESYRKIFKCPLCTEGYFRSIQGKFGSFYKCTSGDVCLSKPRICEKCESPSLDTRNKSICNNLNCKHEMMICDRCGRPMKLKSGKFGQFWGCTGFGIKEDQCKHTRKLI